MDLLPQWIKRDAVEHGRAIIVTDHYFARRVILHLLWIPTTGEQLEARSLAYLLDECHERGLRSVIMARGVRQRPQRYYVMELAELTRSWTHYR